MKLIIASDLHGSAHYTELLIDFYKKSGADKLLLLGDLLYHGPRNDLPEKYDCKAVAELLNSMSDEIISVRGNCDSDVDQMMLDFPCLADYAYINDGCVTMYATHGHVYNKENLPKLQKGTVLLNGHFHVQEFSKEDGYTYVNPGSVSIPKGDNPVYSCIEYENGVFRFIDIEKGSEYQSFSLI